MINQTVIRVSSNHQHDLTRKFPGKGKAAVKVGKIVSASDILAHCEVSAGQRLVKVAHALGVGASSVTKYLIRHVGDRIYQGETIARTGGLLGIGRKEVKSPADGLITSIDANGDLIVKFLPISVRLAAGAGGKIKKIAEDSIVISTVATEIVGPIGSGRERDGAIKIAAAPTEFLLPQHIGADSAGKILVGGALLERSTIEKAVTVGVHGIVVGGVNYRDFLSLGISSDVGLSVLVTEGYGTFPMGADIYDILKKLEGRFAFLSGEKASLVIPELNPKMEKLTEPPVSSWRALAVGDRVRVLHDRQEKLIGKVKRINEEAVLNSGIVAEAATVDLEGNGEVIVAAANLQILES